MLTSLSSTDLYTMVSLGEKHQRFFPLFIKLHAFLSLLVSRLMSEHYEKLTASELFHLQICKK